MNETSERDEEQADAKREAFGRRTALVAAGTVLLGIVASGLWDVVAKPGLGWLGRATLNFITFGSEFVRDTAYPSAALDPTPLSSLVLMVLLVPLPLAFGMFVLSAEFLYPWLRRWVHRVADEAADPEAAKAKLRQRMRRHSRTSAIILIVMGLLGYGFAIVAAGVVNQAVVVWRVFHANLRIVEPYILDTEHEDFSASFAAMGSKADYVRISERFERIAKDHGVALRPEKTW